jgi:ATP-dependent RNA helicase DeaD
MSQEQRDKVMRKVRQGSCELLVATDVAARGLDIEQLTHVINFDVPSAPESYVHRIGRVGRAGKNGVALMLVEPREHRLVRNIEQLTRQKIEMAQLPTVADLRERRRELTQASLREAILAGDLESYRVIIEALCDEFDILDVAAAAVKLVHEESGGDEDQQDIPSGRSDHGFDRPDRRSRYGDRPDDRGREPRREMRPRRGAPRDVERLYIGGAGRKAGVRPGDLVGAITNEAGVSGEDIHGIEIADRFSVVEVSQTVAEQVLEALRATTIRGKKVTARRDRPKE